MRRRTAATAACIACLAGPLPVAQATETEGYNHVPGVLPGTVAAKRVAAPIAATRASSLPFTGSDLAMVGFGAVVLLGLGLTLRRSSRAR